MKKFFKGLALISVVLAGLFAFDREASLEVVFGPMKNDPIDFATLTLSDKPNQYLLCPPDFCSAPPMGDSPEFALSAEDLKQRWDGVIAQAPRIELIRSDEAEMQYDYVQRSALMAYPDTITVKFISVGEGRSTLAIYSRSHYGYSDMGVNEARGLAWLAGLSE